ncbi:hypothetical protein C0993_011202 [Termitomyces sp. T159_Od127]|nr:hypothetical protein C0993_011202 [Termitomyces sp. T159_Od127]
MVQGIDLSIPEQESIVRGESEGVVVVGLVGRGGSGVMLNKEGVLGGIADLVQDTFFVYNQHNMKVFGWDYHSMVKRVALCLKQFLGVHVQSPGEGVRLGTKLARAVVDGEVVLGKDFGPAGLAAAELLGFGEVLQVVVVQVDLDAVQSALEVGLLLLEGFDNGKELLVIDVVVELCGNHRVGVESNRPELVTAGVLLREYTSNGVVRGVTFEDNGERGVKVVEDGGGGEGLLEEGEYALPPAVPVPWGVLPCEPVEGFGDSGVVINEPAVEIGETKERLHLFYALGWRPVEDGFHLGGVHANAVWGDDDTEVVLLESFEDAADVIVVFFQQVQVDEDVVQVHDDENIIHVVKDVVHEVLEGGGGVGHTKGHH